MVLSHRCSWESLGELYKNTNVGICTLCGTQTSAFFEVILIHECQHSLNEKGTKTATVSLLLFIPYTRIHTHARIHTRRTRAQMHTCLCPHLAPPPCPALPWGSGSSNSGTLLHQPNEKEVTSARANAQSGPGAQTHLCLNFSFSTPWALRLLAGSAGMSPRATWKLFPAFTSLLPASPTPIWGPACPPKFFSFLWLQCSWLWHKMTPQEECLSRAHGSSLPISCF